MSASFSNLRHCTECHALFFAGEHFKGLCPATGRGHHNVFGSPDYALWHGVPETAELQLNWRICDRCQAVYYDGFPDKETCDAGDGHRPNPDPRLFNFLVPHDFSGGEGWETNWEFCAKCKVLFRNVNNEVSHCAKGGTHEANPTAFHFLLSHGPNPPIPPWPTDLGTALHPV
jgi:hypothetical protein